MTLSIIKLQKFLKANGFLIQKIFTVREQVVYVEVFNINNAETFLLYIQSKYTINIEDKTNSYKIKYIDINDSDIFKNFNEKIESNETDIQYNNLSFEIDIYSKNDNKDLEKVLKDGYSQELVMKDLIKEDIQNLKDIYYQLSRLTACVKHIKYKLAIIYKNYLCSIKRDNSLECFVIKEYKYHNDRKIHVVVDLENLFENVINISTDIKKVKQGIYKILNENQIKNSIVLNNILQQKNYIILCSDAVYKKKYELELNIKNLEDLLLKINEAEKKLIEKIFHINNDDKNTNIHNDIKNSHIIYNYEKDLEKINIIKEEIVKDILISRSKQENITLEIDQILFDNSVMINIINKNFIKLFETL